MKEYIKQKLVELHKTCITDKYGQIPIFEFQPSNLFGDKANKVIEYCKRNKGILRLNTYGGRYGTYDAFIIIDSDIIRDCSDALSRNKNHIRNLNTW